MMPELFVTTFAAGLLYVFIPGPATLAALSLAASQKSCNLGSLPTFATLANEISVKPEGERRDCGQS